MRLRTAFVLLPAALLLAACSSSADTAEEAAPAPAVVEPVTSCSDFVPLGDEAIVETVRALPEVADHTVTSVRVSTDSDHPGEWALAVSLCDPSIESVEDLRPVATNFAKAVKAQPWTEEVFAVYVSNQWLVDGEPTPELKVKDGDFQLHLWNGKPSEKAENERWEVISG